MGKITTETVTKLMDNYDGHYRDNLERQKILRELVDKHGVELVALAAGFTESTLYQYVRVAHVPAIRHDSVIKATRILLQAEEL